MRLDFSPNKRWLIIGFFILLAVYCLFQARFLILGPRVKIKSPHNGEIVTSNVVTISGTAHNVAWISLNDRPIFTDEEGSWSEKLILQEGASIMSVKARDRFGRETEKSIQIIYKQNYDQEIEG